MSLIFREIDANNWERCIELSVEEDQKEFVADNSYSLLQSKFIEDMYPLAIYDEDTMVGFLMYDRDPDTKRMEMCRLMIDRVYQKKGYGKASILKLLEIIKEKYGSIEFFTSVEPENTRALKLYENLGFKQTGEIMWDEIVLKIKL